MLLFILLLAAIGVLFILAGINDQNVRDYIQGILSQ
jgi:hypothetical protein